MPAEFEREAINRRARAMALARPFFALEQGKGHAGVDLAFFDLGRVALVILDCVIVELGGARGGATYERILDAVRPFLKACRPESTASDADRITSYVIDALTNERERGPFKAEYQIQEEDGSARWVRFPYSLLVLEAGAGGEPIYQPKTPAINFYLSALEIDIEAEQEAKLAVYKYYMRCGKFQEAVQTAETMHKLTISYREKIRQSIALFERDIESIDYTGEVIPALENARTHISRRLEAEGELLADVNVRIDEASGDNLKYLAGSREVFRRNNAFNTALISDLINIDEQYLREQARQRFRPTIGEAVFADPTADVLRPMLACPVRMVGEWMSANWHRFLPVVVPAVPSLTDLVQHLLQEPQPRLPGDVVEEDESVELPPMVRFDEATVSEVAAVIDGLPARFTLTEALAAGRLRGLGSGALLCLALRVLQWYEGSDGITVTRAGVFADGDFAGDDLSVKRSAI